MRNEPEGRKLRLDVAIWLVLPAGLLALAFSAGWPALLVIVPPVVSAFYGGRAFQRWVDWDEAQDDVDEDGYEEDR